MTNAAISIQGLEKTYSNGKRALDEFRTMEAPVRWWHVSLPVVGGSTMPGIRLPGGGHLAVMQQNRDTHFAPQQGSKVTLWWDKRHLMTFGG